MPSRKKTVVVAMLGATLAFFSFIILSVEISANDNSKDLKLLHVIMRHGIRTPVDTYPKDPYINETLFPIGWGHLTNEGKLELYNVGKYLRTRYDNFLGNKYKSDEYYTQTTDVDRTKSSAQLVNAGLWPPTKEEKWGPLDWQPIPTHSEPLHEDNLLLVRRPCPQYHIELDRIMKSKEIQNKLEENKSLMKEITDHTGKEIKTFDDIMDIYSTLRAEEAFGLKLPNWTKEYYPDKMHEPTVFSFILNAYNDKLNRLKGGVLLKKLIQDWKQKSEGTIKPKDRKAFLYIGHDSTIVNILSALKVWDPQIPEYAITILMEFSKDKITNTEGVEIYLRNSTKTEPYLLQIPGCDTFCPLNKLVDLTKNVVPNNWEEECKTDDKNYEVPELGGP